MEYYLRQNIRMEAVKLSLSQQEYNTLIDSRNVLSSAFALEEYYNIIICNYLEFEQELIIKKASNPLEMHEIYCDAFDIQSKINRRIVNLLAAIRLYIDGTIQLNLSCDVDKELMRKEFKLLASCYYDTYFEYRFLDALRNHTQHCGTAVHSISFSILLEGIGDQAQPFSLRKFLAENNKFKKSILNEMPEKVDLTIVIRKYLDCIKGLHKLARKHLTEHSNMARQTIKNYISNYAKANDDSTVVGLTLYKIDFQGKKTLINLLLDWDDVRITLIKRNEA